MPGSRSTSKPRATALSPAAAFWRMPAPPPSPSPSSSRTWSEGARRTQKITLGLIGCGGRGTWIADLFQKHGGYNIVALADYFPDRVEAAGNKLGVPAAQRFTGLSAYRRLLEQKLDAVAIESPPFFHPTPGRRRGGCRQARLPGQAGGRGRARLHDDRAERRRRPPPASGVSSSTSRRAPRAPFIEAMRRVHGGALGDLRLRRGDLPRRRSVPRESRRRHDRGPRKACSADGASRASTRATSSPSRTSTRSTS